MRSIGKRQLMLR